MKNDTQLQARRKNRTDEAGWFDAFEFKLPKHDAEKWLKKLSEDGVFDYRIIKKGGKKPD